MDGKRYPVKTLFDMAAIPVEAEARFLAEMPSMLAEIRKVRDMQGIFKAIGVEIDMEGAEPPVWIDDDKGTATVRFSTEQGVSLEIKSNIK